MTREANLNGDVPDDVRLELDVELTVYRRIHDLATKAYEGDDASEGRELASLLASDELAREVYIQYVQETSCLRGHAFPPEQEVERSLLAECDWLHSDRVTGTEAPATVGLNVRGQRSHWGLFAIAAALLILIVPSVFQISWRSSASSDTATVVRATDVIWGGGSGASLQPLSRVGAGRQVDFVSGQVELVFDSGVELLVTGPASLRIDSPSRVVANRGTYWARVGDEAKGFTIDTPASTVTDLGTEFGVAIQGDDTTTVAVFDGEVDVTPTDSSSAESSAPPIRLVQGEAIGVSRNGDYERVVSMKPDEYPTAASRPGAYGAGLGLIADVSDNLSGPETRKYYRIVRAGFREDAQAFVDRDHEWNGADARGLPSFLLGADYVMPFNDDKFLGGLEVSVRVRRACMMYVLFDNNMPTPDWLKARFTDTEFDVGLDHGAGPFTKGAEPELGPGVGIDNHFSVWSMRVDGECSIEFGSGRKPEDKLLGWNMFGIVAAPLAADSEPL